jgi:hypothetical protein
MQSAPVREAIVWLIFREKTPPPSGATVSGKLLTAVRRTIVFLSHVERPDDAAHPRDLKAIVINTQRKNLRQLHAARHARRLIREGHYVRAELARELHLRPPRRASDGPESSA